MSGRSGPGRVVDVALMAPVPPRGLRTPMTASGPAAQEFAAAMRRHGAAVEVIDGPVGAAATRKLMRSVFYKGLATAVVEALAAAGRPAWTSGSAANIAAELMGFDESTLDGLSPARGSTPGDARTRWRRRPTARRARGTGPGEPGQPGLVGGAGGPDQRVTGPGRPPPAPRPRSAGRAPTSCGSW